MRVQTAADGSIEGSIEAVRRNVDALQTAEIENGRAGELIDEITRWADRRVVACLLAYRH